MVSDSAQSPVVAVTGGAGFLGRALLRELRKPEGEAVLRPAETRVLDLKPVPDPGDGISCATCDVRSREDLRRAFAGTDVVFHLAAVIDWGQCPADLVRAVNVDGTRNVIEACRDAGVKALVFTSSLDAVYAGRSLHDVDETQPYPAEFPSTYCATKAEGEQLVLAANGASLHTLVVRPASIWGENDPYHAAAMLELARRGPVPRMGREPAPTQFVYVGNVAHLLALAARALLENRPGATGELFFATDFPARNFFDHMEPLVRAAGGRMLPRFLALPRAPMHALGWTLELAARLLRPVWKFEPLFTRFSVDYVCNEFTVRTDKAERLLGYRPIYDEAGAVARCVDSIHRSCQSA